MVQVHVPATDKAVGAPPQSYPAISAILEASSRGNFLRHFLRGHESCVQFLDCTEDGLNTCEGRPFSSSRLNVVTVVSGKGGNTAAAGAAWHETHAHRILGDTDIAITRYACRKAC